MAAEGATSGWGGHRGDALAVVNTRTVFMAVSAAGSASLKPASNAAFGTAPATGTHSPNTDAGAGKCNLGFMTG